MIYSINEIRQKIASASKNHPVERVYLFGSYARGEATEQSDIDIRIEAPNMRGLWGLGGYYADLESVLGKELSLVETEGIADEEFRNRIAKDEILLYERK